MSLHPSPSASAYANGVLRELLDERGMTPEDIADASGVGVQIIRNRVADYGEWYVNQIAAVARAFGVPTSTFLEE